MDISKLRIMVVILATKTFEFKVEWLLEVSPESCPSLLNTRICKKSIIFADTEQVIVLCGAMDWSRPQRTPSWWHCASGLTALAC